MTAPPLDQPAAPEQPSSGPAAGPGAAASDAGLPSQVEPSSLAEPSGGSPTEPGGEPSSAGSQAEPGGGSSPEDAGESSGFTVRLANFTGPFDLLLQLIGKHKLDVTEVALHQVTDEFIAYIRAMGDQWDLDEASEFLLIAATLLDLKAARLLPAAEVEDEEDLALLEARDLLFARLLQYKAFKEAAAFIADLEAVGGRRYPRAVSLEPRYAEALPDLVLGIGAERLRTLAVRAMTPKVAPEVSIAHVHMVRVSVREHAAIISERLRRAGTATFSTLCADCEATLEVVARFLALLELYREGLVAFVQEQALEELTIRWTGPADGGSDLQIDEYAGTPAEAGTPETAAAGPADPAADPTGSRDAGTSED
ncbi:segregation and condensation protein A [Micromonospora avicenniae]|uniref:Segregation and condensation protein A n=1 Tax=Micromonospora avicenniae TaxID=1198245 RepID=A0A1N7DS78_9ACTN|nr:ScpA family protein [Micromonospora avicenniae]SIR78601.1 condensin subunit ScpA [Micromonospora avicenniae]